MQGGTKTRFGLMSDLASLVFFFLFSSTRTSSRLALFSVWSSWVPLHPPPPRLFSPSLLFNVFIPFCWFCFSFSFSFFLARSLPCWPARLLLCFASAFITYGVAGPNHLALLYLQCASPRRGLCPQSELVSVLSRRRHSGLCWMYIVYMGGISVCDGHTSTWFPCFCQSVVLFS